MPQPRVFEIPYGWTGSNPSTRPLYLESAEQFGHGKRPTPDGWVHVAPLTPVPMRIVITTGVLTAFLTVIEVMLFSGITRGDSALASPVAWVVGIVFGVIDLFFVLTFINSLQAFGRRRWPYTEGIAFGQWGLMIRMQRPIRADVAWEDITEISALMRRPGSPSTDAAVPILYITRGDEQWSINPDVLGSSPAAVYTLLFHYWTHPEERAELGTTFAQQRMDVLAGAAPVSVAPWVQRFTGFDQR